MISSCRIFITLISVICLTLDDVLRRRWFSFAPFTYQPYYLQQSHQKIPTKKEHWSVPSHILMINLWQILFVKKFNAEFIFEKGCVVIINSSDFQCSLFSTETILFQERQKSCFVLLICLLNACSHVWISEQVKQTCLIIIFNSCFQEVSKSLLYIRKTQEVGYYKAYYPNSDQTEKYFGFMKCGWRMCSLNNDFFEKINITNGKRPRGKN